MNFGHEKIKLEGEEEQLSVEETVEEETGPSKEEELQAQLEEMKNNWLRAVADLENFRRRAAREKEEALKYGSVNFARDIVSIVDNIQRALASCPSSEDLPAAIQSLIAGVEMIGKEVNNAFERQNLKKINALGEKFDPNLHQAMFEVEMIEKEPGTIVEVLQDGYTMHDRLVRAAMVGVAKAPNL
jgi:molecular chaperone GrpE